MKHRAIFAFLLATALSCSSSSSSKNHSDDTTAPATTPVTDHPANANKSKRPIDPRERLIGMVVTRMLEVEHLRKRPVDDSVSKKALDRYLDQLDPAKLFLLSSHVKQLRAHELLMDDELKDGSLALAHDGAAIYAKRIAVVGALVAARLAKPFDFTIKEDMEVDPDKRDWATSEAALADRWRRVLKLQVLGRAVRMAETLEAIKKAKKKGEKLPPSTFTSKIPKTAAGRAKKAREDLIKTYSARFTRLAASEPIENAAMFINAITGVYDPHTSYLAPATKENFDIRMSGSLEGIGAVLSEDDHYIRIVNIVPGGASWRQGELEADDLILSVAQDGKEPVGVGDMRINKVVKMIRGPKGTLVTLTIKKPDGEIKVVPITRDVVKIETAYARGAILEPGKSKTPVGYIYLPSFYGNTRRHPGQTPPRSCTKDVRQLLSMFRKRGVTAAIIDLRGNGGGLLKDAEEISGLFIETGPIVQTRTGDGKVEILSDKDPSITFRGRVVVLVNRFSASASEIVAAALQDYGRAVVVGTAATHGKGTVQVLLNLDRFRSASKQDKPLGVLKMTSQQFFRINGASTQWRGVVPDILLPGPAAHVDSGERTLDNSIPWSSVEPMNFQRWSAASWNRDALIARSKARQAKQPVFAKYVRRSALLRKRRKNTRVSLEKAEWIRTRDKDRKQLEAVSPDTSKGPPLFKVKELRYDGSVAPAPRPRRGRKAAVNPATRWIVGLSRDVWVAESLNVLRDMAAGAPSVR